MCPQAEEILASCIVMPCSEWYAPSDVQDIVDAIAKVATYYRKHPVEG